VVISERVFANTVFVLAATVTSKGKNSLSVIITIGVERAGIAQSVERRATGRTVGVRFLAGQDFLFSLASRPALGVHPSSYQIGTGAKERGA
jgi:hypothetical protein